MTDQIPRIHNQRFILVFNGNEREDHHSALFRFEFFEK